MFAVFSIAPTIRPAERSAASALNRPANVLSPWPGGPASAESSVFSIADSICLAPGSAASALNRSPNAPGYVAKRTFIAKLLLGGLGRRLTSSR